MFCKKNYKKLMITLKKRNYHVRPLSGFKGRIERPTILLRFDVDYCPQMALEIAKINVGLDISGTFFFQMDSQLYNLFNKDTQGLLQNLYLLKQEIGWHLPFIKGKLTKNYLIACWEIFKTAIPSAVPLIAWHNPQRDLIDEANAVVKSSRFLKSVYAPPFISNDVRYLSDSNFRNGFEDMMRILHVDKNPQVQLLLHPLNWIIGGDNMGTILNATWNILLQSLDKEFSTNPNWRGEHKLPIKNL